MAYSVLSSSGVEGASKGKDGSIEVALDEDVERPVLNHLGKLADRDREAIGLKGAVLPIKVLDEDVGLLKSVTIGGGVEDHLRRVIQLGRVMSRKRRGKYARAVESSVVNDKEDLLAGIGEAADRGPRAIEFTGLEDLGTSDIEDGLLQERLGGHLVVLNTL